MKISYVFTKEYLEQLISLKGDLSDLLESPEGELIFEDGDKKISTNPDTFFAFVDWIYGEIEELSPGQKYEHDIWGTPHNFVFDQEKLMIVSLTTGEIEFSSTTTHQNLIHVLDQLIKQVKEEIEQLQPEVKNNTIWKSYYFNQAG